MPTGQKSPLHSSALTINGLNPGRTIVRFNRYGGTGRAFVVMERPVVRSVILDTATRSPMCVVTIPPNATVVHKNTQVVKLRDVKTGTVEYQYLTDLGVVPMRGGRFNDANFVVDHCKKHLLPTTRVSYPAHMARIFDEEDFFGDVCDLEF